MAMDDIKYCVLDSSKLCTVCCECDRCDLFPDKFCDNCGKCLGIDGIDYSEIRIDGIIDDASELDEYLLDEYELQKIHSFESRSRAERVVEYEFIEDIPELKKIYDKKINDILHGRHKEN